MQICGLNKTTLLDYPGHVAATVFLGGCNFRCPYCHNSDLVLNPGLTPFITPDELNAFLAKRKNILSGICITGGEPTLHKDLPEFIKNIKDFGYCVKLDTNGTNPGLLQMLLNDNLLDYIAMDIKSDMEHYATAAGLTPQIQGFATPKVCEGTTAPIVCEEAVATIVCEGAAATEAFLHSVKASVDLIKNSGIDYEFRTTVVKELHTEEILTNMALWLSGSNSYYLQNYEENENVLNPGFHSYTKEELEHFALLFKPHCKHVGIRGV